MPAADEMNKPEQRLLRCFSRLDEQQRQTLLSFAEFLAGQNQGPQNVDEAETETGAAAIEEPKPIPRPERETVVAAIKRLSASFHMLDKAKVLHETSSLMAQHMLQGRDAREVIDELEVVFERHYHKLRGEQEQGRDDACKS